MAFSSGTLSHFIRLGREGHIPKGARVLELGSQNIYDPLTEAPAFFAVFGAHVTDLAKVTEVGIKAEHLMKAAGFEYAAFDVYREGDTRIFDLNFDRIGWRDRGRYDVVTNLGTSEHVCNQLNVFKVAHDALKVGGVMLTQVPFYGFIDHGLVTYNPKFFSSLIKNNGYQALYFSLSDIFKSEVFDTYTGVSNAINGALWETRHIGCAEMCVIWKKTTKTAFQPPTDTGGHITINAVYP